MTTLLSIAQDALEDIGGHDVPQTVIGNDDETATLLKAGMNTLGRQLRRFNFEELKVEYTFSTVASQTAYDTPDGYRKMIVHSFWDRTNDRMVRGPVSSAVWQHYQSSGIGPVGIDRYWRKRGGQIDIYPTPSSADSLVYEYYSSYWCQSSAEVGQENWQADTDTAVLDAELLRLGVRYRFLNAKGEPYQEEYDEFVDYRDSLLTINEGPVLINMGGQPLNKLGVVLPDTGYGQ